MSIEDLRNDAAEMTHWERHKFFVLVASVIVISFFLVSVALSLYNSSGAAQLDLSRPGYQDVRDQARRDTTAKSFPSTGELDQEALDTFKKLYADRAAKVTSVDSFDATALSPESLQLFAAPSEPAPIE